MSNNVIRHLTAPHRPNAERMWRVRSVAELLGVSADTVYRLINEGKLMAKRLDTPARQIRIPDSELVRYQEGLEDATPDGSSRRRGR